MADIEILAFRADERASKGITTAHLDDVIAGYDPNKQPAPIVIGHPSNDAPAHGVVSGMRRDGSNLFVTLKDLGKEVIEGVRQSKLVGRSIAFFDPSHPSNPNPGKFAMRHFGFLGAQAPGIPNLGKLAFAAEDNENELLAVGDPAPAVIFAAAPTAVTTINEPPAPGKPAPQQEQDTVTEEEQRQFAADKVAFEKEKTEFAATQKADRETRHGTLVDGLVAGGQILPADKDALVKAFNAIPAGTVEFSADDKSDPVVKIAAIMAKAGKITPGAGDTRITPAGDPPKSQFDGGSAKDAADAALAAENARQATAFRAPHGTA